MKKLFYLFLISFISMNLFAQNQNEDVSVLQTIIIDGDTIPIVFFPEFTIEAEKEKVFASKKEEKRYNKLKEDVIKVYPYAKLAGDLLVQYDQELGDIASKKQKKDYSKIIEEEIDSKYGKELGRLSTSQAIILIKLVDRQTGHTSYKILQEYRGYISAFIWQGLARMFGHNLKDDYEENGDEKMIEEIIAEIEREQIEVTYSELRK